MVHSGKEILSKNSKYIIENIIGSGAFSDVYKGKKINDNDPGRSVAVKFLKTDSFASSRDRKEIVKRFKEEAIIHQKLCASYSEFNRNIVYIEDFIEDEMAIVQEYINGKNSGETHQFYYDIKFAAERFIEVLRSIVYIHNCGIIHRDIKPSNILIEENFKNNDHVYVAKICDFGISKNIFHSLTSHKGTFLGTMAYASPEQIFEPEKISYTSDIFSLGMTFYNLLSGGIDPYNRNFGNQSSLKDELKEMDKVINSKPTSIKDFNPDIPEQLEKIILKAIVPEPINRYTNSFDFLSDLIDFQKQNNTQSKSCSIKKNNIIIEYENNKYRFYQNLITIGSGENNDIVIDDQYISSAHCRIEKRNNGLVFIDNSTNGSKVNDVLIKKTEIVLKNNDTLILPFDHNMKIKINQE